MEEEGPVGASYIRKVKGWGFNVVLQRDLEDDSAAQKLAVYLIRIRIF